MKKITAIIALYLLLSCNQNHYKDIEFGNTLIENQTLSENRKLYEAVKKTVKLDSNGLAELINLNCGGAAGCYDLGAVITQIISKIGERDFLKMTKKLDSKQKLHLKSLIEVGLEYGPINTEMNFEKVWPKLYKELNK
ncbi:hypothetical protein [Flavobacterium suncheonense]|uniref:Lipoprotein n=1 Tax=Flavobacterium suncheonense GH29-5 = DSM 17707 TaxID=1121899 RepID=A0A0A2LZD6_9FLAO|nr:hypothetical protein [Flavobacterium suncheonense]KGO84578.1 hypothetical protein Q764_14475 [Flavobacterium suncheonense GH29-5 = DSM 17707]